MGSVLLRGKTLFIFGIFALCLVCITISHIDGLQETIRLLRIQVQGVQNVSTVSQGGGDAPFATANGREERKDENKTRPTPRVQSLHVVKSNAQKAVANSKVSTNNQTGCGPVRFAPKNKRFPITALATYPGSGNTWTRHLIQQLTGYQTGSVYDDLTLKANGFPGEYWMNGSVIAIKTHYTGDHHRLLRKFAKAIIVMRSPLDAMKAEFKRRSSGHTGAVNETVYSSEIWEEYVKTETQHWERFHQDWLQSKIPKLVLFYEELKSDLVSCLKQLCEFLKTEPVCTQEKLNCVTGNSKGNFYRKKVPEKVKIFSDEMLKTVSDRVTNVYKLLERCVRLGGCTRNFTVWPIGLVDV